MIVIASICQVRRLAGKWIACRDAARRFKLLIADIEVVGAVIVREAQEDDLASIARLAQDLATHVDDSDPGSELDLLRENLFGDDRWARCFVATENDVVIAFAVVCRIFEAHTRRRHLWLSDLAVSKNHQNRGIGRLLVEHLKSLAAACGCHSLNLELWIENHSAKAFYDRVGAKAAEDVTLLRIPSPSTR